MNHWLYVAIGVVGAIGLGGGVALNTAYRQIHAPLTGRETVPIAEPFALSGERVTRESGEAICTLTAELRSRAVATAKGWCENWTITPPADNEPIPDDPPGKQWVRRGPKGGLQLHIEKEWKP